MTPRTTPDPTYSNHKKQVTKLQKRKVVIEKEVAERNLEQTRITKITKVVDQDLTIETLTTKLDNQTEEEDSRINQPKELDLTQEGNKDQTIELQSIRL